MNSAHRDHPPRDTDTRDRILAAGTELLREFQRGATRPTAVERQPMASSIRPVTIRFPALSGAWDGALVTLSQVRPDRILVTECTPDGLVRPEGLSGEFTVSPEQVADLARATAEFWRRNPGLLTQARARPLFVVQHAP